MFGLSTLTRYAVPALLIAALLALASLSMCRNSRQDAAQARQDARTASATTEAAKDAVATVVARSDAEAGLRQVVNEAAKDISNAEGSNQPIPPAARDAALRAACRLPNYHDEPACALLQPRP